MKTALRRRVSPSVPFLLEFEDEQGKFSERYQLAYNWNSLALIEEKLGKSMLLEISTVFENVSVANVSILLWAALQEYHSADFAGDEGLELLRQNLTLAAANLATTACASAYVKQLPLEQQRKIEEIRKTAAEGVQAAPTPPLAETPAAV